MFRLLYAMKEINAAGSFADRFWENEEMYVKAEAEMFDVFKEFPRLKEALPKLYEKLVEKRRDGFSLSEMASLKRNKIFTNSTEI